MTTEPTAFFKNSIEPFVTKWVSCSPIIKNWGPNAILKSKTVMTPIYHDKVYSFLLFVEGKHYFYQTKPIDLASSKVIIKRLKNLLPPEESHIYLEETMKILSLYREPLNEFTILHLDQRLSNLTREPVFKDFSPKFFYQNLQNRAKINDSVSVLEPGSDPVKKRCVIRPVYGPSHNPLEITLGDVVIRVIFRTSVVKNGKDEININMDPYYGKEDAIPLLILDLVSMIASKEVEMISPQNLVKLIKERPVLKKGELIKISQSRSNVLEKDVYWASKLHQLAFRKMPLEKNANQVATMIQELRESYVLVENEVVREERIINTLKNMIQDYHDLFSTLQ